MSLSRLRLVRNGKCDGKFDFQLSGRSFSAKPPAASCFYFAFQLHANKRHEMHEPLNNGLIWRMTAKYGCFTTMCCMKHKSRLLFNQLRCSGCRH